MDEETRQLLEELKKITNARDLNKFTAANKKVIKDLEDKGAKEAKILKDQIRIKERLMRAEGNLAEHFKKLGGRLGMTEVGASKLGRAARNTTDFVGKFGEALYEGTGSISDFTSALKEFGPVGEVLASVGTSFETSIQAFRTLSTVGGTFGQSLVELRETATRAGLPLADFVDLVAKNSEALAQLFGTTSEGARRFATFSETFRQNNIEALAPLGLTIEEINEQLITNLTLQRRTGNFVAGQTEQQLQSGRRLIMQLDRLAKLTGAQRDELAKTIESQMSNERFLAFLGQQTEETAQRLAGFSAGIEKLAPGLAEGFQDLIANAGVPVTDAAQQLIMNTPEASAIIQQLTAGSITTEQALVDLRDAAKRSNTALANVAQTGTVDFARLFAEVNKLATATLDTTKMTEEQRAEAEALTRQLTQFEDASKRTAGAIQSIETGFQQFIGGLLGEGPGSLNNTMNGLAETVRNLSPELKAALYTSGKVIEGTVKTMRDAAPITAGTYAALKMAGVGPGGMGFGGTMAGGMGLGKGGMASKLLRGGGLVGAGLGAVSAAGNLMDGDKSNNAGAIGTLAGTALGAFFGPVGMMLGGMAGGAIGNMIGGRQYGTMGTLGLPYEPKNVLTSLHSGERVLSPTETAEYNTEQVTGGSTANFTMLAGKLDNMNTSLISAVTEMKSMNKGVNTLVAVGNETAKNTNITQRRLANKTESII